MFTELQSKLIQQAVDPNNESKYVRRYLVEKPDLDDVRFGFARIDTRGYIKWIRYEKLTKKTRKKLGLWHLGRAMAEPIRRTLSYQGIARKLFIIDSMSNPT